MAILIVAALSSRLSRYRPGRQRGAAGVGGTGFASRGDPKTLQLFDGVT
jgi:hypothetical protein